MPESAAAVITSVVATCEDAEARHQVPVRVHVERQRDLVRHRPGGHVQGRVLPDPLRGEFLQAVGRGIVPVPGVSHLGIGHRPAHGR